MDSQSNVQVYKSTDWHEPMYIDPRITFEVKPATVALAPSSLKLDRVEHDPSTYSPWRGPIMVQTDGS